MQHVKKKKNLVFHRLLSLCCILFLLSSFADKQSPLKVGIVCCIDRIWRGVARLAGRYGIPGGGGTASFGCASISQPACLQRAAAACTDSCLRSRSCFLRFESGTVRSPSPVQLGKGDWETKEFGWENGSAVAISATDPVF